MQIFLAVTDAKKKNVPFKTENIFKKKKIFFDGGRRAILSGVCGGPQDAAVTAIFLAVTDAKKKNVPFNVENIFQKKLFFSTGAEGRSYQDSRGAARFFWP